MPHAITFIFATRLSILPLISYHYYLLLQLLVSINVGSGRATDRLIAQPHPYNKSSSLFGRVVEQSVGAHSIMLYVTVV